MYSSLLRLVCSFSAVDPVVPPVDDDKGTVWAGPPAAVPVGVAKGGAAMRDGFGVPRSTFDPGVGGLPVGRVVRVMGGGIGVLLLLLPSSCA